MSSPFHHDPFHSCPLTGFPWFTNTLDACPDQIRSLYFLSYAALFSPSSLFPDYFISRKYILAWYSLPQQDKNLTSFASGDRHQLRASVVALVARLDHGEPRRNPALVLILILRLLPRHQTTSPLLNMTRPLHCPPLPIWLRQMRENSVCVLVYLSLLPC
jgi:hypothetical protein